MDEVMDMLYKILEKILDFLRKNHHFQNYINSRYVEHNDVLLVKKKYLTDCTTEINGKLFYITKCIDSVEEINNDYKYEDIRKDDIVVDIGANVGGFSITVSDKCRRLYAVEPLFVKELENNLRLNNVGNCTIIPKGLGKGYTKLEFKSNIQMVDCISFKDIKNMVGGKIDFLKMDCEGGEWFISRDDLDGIRRIEMELHLFNKEKINDFLKILIDAGFVFEIDEHRKDYLYIIHAKNRY